MDLMVEFFGSKAAAKSRSDELAKRWSTVHTGKMKAGDDFVLRKWTSASTVADFPSPIPITGEMWVGVFVEKPPE